MVAKKNHTRRLTAAEIRVYLAERDALAAVGFTSVTQLIAAWRALAGNVRDRFLGLSEVQHRVRLGRSAIYLRVQRGEFPPPVPLGGRAVGWPESAIDAWVELTKAGERWRSTQQITKTRGYRAPAIGHSLPTSINVRRPDE